MTGIVKCEGLLAHHFHGNYWASIVLAFQCRSHAADALAVLGDPWQVSKQDSRALVCAVNSEALDAVKAKLASFGADPKKIDSLAKSVDYGERFYCSIPVIAAEQSALFGKEA